MRMMVDITFEMWDNRKCVDGWPHEWVHGPRDWRTLPDRTYFDRCVRCDLRIMNTSGLPLIEKDVKIVEWP